MRSTRASAAIARLNARQTDRHYMLTSTGDSRFILSARTAGGSEALTAPLPLDEFVRAVDAMGPQPVRRMTRSDIAFEKQLTRKPAVESGIKKKT